MGLLDIFIQNQSQLDVTPTPQQGNGPIAPATGEFNTGTTPFQQVWDSSNTYINSFEGGTNVGIQPPTLSETGLDVDNPNFIPSTTTPDTLTYYPATAVGGLGQSALQFLQIWTPVINYNDVVVGAPTSPLEQSLNQTGLDNTEPNAVPTTVSPDTTTVYPSLATGEYNSVSNQYNQVYTSNNTYLNSFNPDTQVNSLTSTGLDIENNNAAPTTTIPSTVTQYPLFVQGEFNGAPNQYSQIWGPANQYFVNYNPDIQSNTLDETGLDLENSNAAPTTYAVPTTDDTFSTGDVPLYVHAPTAINNSAPRNYTQTWSPNNTDTKYYDYMRSNFQLNYL
jgi:hypothetical protein